MEYKYKVNVMVGSNQDGVFVSIRNDIILEDLVFDFPVRGGEDVYVSNIDGQDLLLGRVDNVARYASSSESNARNKLRLIRIGTDDAYDKYIDSKGINS